MNDEFIIHHPNAHYSKQKLIEVIPNKKIVWLVTESTLYWLQNDKQEWTNTKMIFEISTKGDKTMLHFTHEGLIPKRECYARCERGWTMVIKDCLFNYITNGKSDINKMGKKDFHTAITVNASAKRSNEKNKSGKQVVGKGG